MRRMLLTIIDTDDEYLMRNAVKTIRNVSIMTGRVDGVGIRDQIFFPSGHYRLEDKHSRYHDLDAFEDIMKVSDRAMNRVRPHCRSRAPFEHGGHELHCMRRSDHDDQHLTWVGETKVEWS